MTQYEQYIYAIIHGTHLGIYPNSILIEHGDDARNNRYFVVMSSELPTTSIFEMDWIQSKANIYELRAEKRILGTNWYYFYVKQEKK